MDKTAIHDGQREVFGRLMLLPNKLQIAGDRSTAGREMTTRQWLLTVAVTQFGESTPSLKEVSELMGCTHQNVKQLAMKLQKNGYIQMYKQEKDLRETRLKLTEKCRLYWESIESDFTELFIGIFSDMSEDEINAMYETLNKLYKNIEKLEVLI